MDPTTLTIGGIAIGALGFGIGAVFGNWLAQKLVKAQRELIEAQDQLIMQVEHTRDAVFCRLLTLRRNAFITNERGHRVRYVKASQEARAKAEGGV